jgi:hypothetical protein
MEQTETFDHLSSLVHIFDGGGFGFLTEEEGVGRVTFWRKPP